MELLPNVAFKLQRKRAGLSRSQLAAVIGRSPAYIRNIEQGIVPVTAKLLDACETRSAVWRCASYGPRRVG